MGIIKVSNEKKNTMSLKDHQPNLNGVPRLNRYNDQSLSINIKTFGTPDYSLCKVVNSSISGLLIYPSEKALPFQVKTLTEIEVRCSDNSDIEEDIKFLGRVVRIDQRNESENMKCFGIQIIDIEEHDKNLWKEHVCELKEQDNMKDMAA